MRLRIRHIVIGSAAVLAALAAGAGVFVASLGARGHQYASVIPRFGILARSSPATPNSQVLLSDSDIASGIDRSRVQISGSHLGRYDSKLWLFPSRNGDTVCYALTGAQVTDPGMTYCYTPDSPAFAAVLNGRHFNVSTLYSNLGGEPRVQLYGVAYDDVTALRASVSGKWLPLSFRNNGFYLDLPGANLTDIAKVEATLTDGTVQTQTFDM